MKRMIICLLCVVMLCGCANTCAVKDQEKPTVVTTIFPLYDFARAVGGNNIQIKMLIKPGSEVHHYDPLPSDMNTVYNSHLFLYIGGESDKWVNTLCNSANINAVPLINEVSCYDKHTHHNNHTHADEHIWTSPDNAVLMLQKIRDCLIEIDTANAEVYRKNCDDYIQKINIASKEIESVVSKHKNPFLLVADRFPFEYFTENYGIEYEAAFDGCAVNTDISLKTMLRLTETIKKRGIKTVFCTELSSRNIAKALSEELDVEVIELHSAHNVTVDDFNDGITYVDIMYRNAQALEGRIGS